MNTGKAITRADRAKRWQTVVIFAIGRNLKADVLAMCADFYQCRPSELSRGHAEEFIERLKQIRRTEAV